MNNLSNLYLYPVLNKSVKIPIFPTLSTPNRMMKEERSSNHLSKNSNEKNPNDVTWLDLPPI